MSLKMSHYKKRFMGTTAVALVLCSAVAEAKTAKPTSAASTQAQEIRELRAQIQALTARLDAQQAVQQQVQVQAADAQAKASEVAENAQATQAQVTAQAEAMPDQVKMALANAPKPKSQWFDETKISGRMYYNVSEISRYTNGVKTEGDGGFAIKRFYIGIDHKFDDIFAVNLTTDIDNVVGQTNNLVGKGLYVKKAYVEAKLNPAFILRLGSADLPWVPFVEGIYGYRHIEQIEIDRTKFGTSADWGVHALGSFANGLISYQVSAVDGGGYRDPHFSKTIDLEGRVSAQYKGFTAAVGGYTGKLGKATQGVTTFHTAERFDALVAYKGKMFSVGAEYFHTKNWTQVTSLTADSADGYSVFGSVSPIAKVSIFGRYDWLKPKKDTNNGFKDEYYNIGIQYSPAKIVDFGLVYKHDKAQNGILSTGNGLIGGSVDGTYSEFGLFGQVRF
jgi:hypothetical protein